MAKRSRTAPPTSRSRLWFSAVLGLALVLGGLWLYRRSGAPSLPPASFRDANLLVVTIDTLRADRLGSYGSAFGLTPHLDRLAGEGVRFDRVFAHAPLTLPSHTSIFTSKYPVGHGVRDNGAFRVGDSQKTLAAVMKDAGYATGAFVGAFVLDARFGLDQGFDHYDDFYGEKRSRLSFDQLERRGDEVVAAAERWIRKSAGKRWFAWVHVFDPHAPYDAPPELKARHPNDPYGAELAFVDQVLGSFLERLAQSGELAETLVVVLGDHGESLGEHGERTHGTFAYDSTLRVPWILWAARGMTPQVFPDTVRHVDVMPTLLDLLGVAAPPGIVGQSLRPYLNRELSYEAPPHYFEAMNVHLTRDWAPLSGVVHRGHKLIRLPVPELYDLTRDPGEKENLYRQKTGLARRLEETLDDIAPGSGLVETKPPDLETVERLRSLGYLVAPASSRKGEYTAEDDPKRLIDLSNAFDEATELFGRGRVEEAIRILQDILRKQPRSSDAHQSLAYALHRAGRAGEAIGILEGALRRGIQDVGLMSLLGAYLLDVSDLERARALLEDLVRREPDHAEGHNYLGVAYGRLGRFDEARREFERVLELDPSSAGTYNNLGSLALSQGKLEEAVLALGKALEIDPELASAHNGLGVAHARRGDVASAIESWRRAFEIDPGQFDALYNAAMALAERSPKEAVPYLERFTREAPAARYQPDIERAKALLRSLEEATP